MCNDCRITWKKLCVNTIALVPLASALTFYFLCFPLSYKTQKQIYSEQYGYEIWEDIQKLSVELSVEDVIKGIRAKEEGKIIVGTNNTFSRTTIAALRREALEEEASQNLKRSEQFLKKIAKDSNMVMLDPYRLYYEVKNKGNGTQRIEPSSTAYFHYIITTMDKEKIVDTRVEEAPKKVFLDTAIPAFSKGVIGMKQGERRLIYAHPELAYRKLRPAIPPEILVTIDVEVVKIL